MAKSKRRPLAVLRVNSIRRIGDFISRILTILANIAGDAVMFPTPSPTVASVEGHIETLVTTGTAVGQRVPGSVALRNQAYSVVKDDVYALQKYVQVLANEAGDEQASIAVITASGFDLKINGVFEKPPLAVKPTITTGMVKLVAKSAGPRSSYNWQQSSNNAVTWIDLPTTLRADTTVSGLASKAPYQFRVRSITKEGTSAWSTPVQIVIQ